MARAMPAAHSVFRGTAEPRPRKFCSGSSGMMLSGWRPVPPKLQLGHALQVQQHADRADHLAERRRVAQRAEHEEVGHQADQHAPSAARRTRASQIPTPESESLIVTGTLSQSVGRKSTHGSWISAVAARLVEREHAVHGHRAVGEVDDARAPVDDDEAGAEHGVDRAEAEAEDQEEDAWFMRAPRVRVVEPVAVPVWAPGPHRQSPRRTGPGRTGAIRVRA